jgi:hypothetical protein
VDDLSVRQARSSQARVLDEKELRIGRIAADLVLNEEEGAEGSLFFVADLL